MNPYAQPSSHDQAPKRQPDERGVIWLAYVLYCCVFFTGGLSAIVGLIMNYIKRNDQDVLMSGHMRWQIETFWRALAGCIVLGVVCFLLALSVVGIVFVYPLVTVLAIWYVYRLIKGMLALNAGRPVD